jgi:uncharacterized membrane protein YdcZ (DUF606 family)
MDPTAHGSENFTLWAKAVWPYVVGVFGMMLIFIDIVVFPPPDTTTSGVGMACITGMGYVGLNRSRKGADDAE